MISYSWIYTNPIVRHSRRRFSNFVGGGRRPARQMFNAPKNMQHKAIQPHAVDETKADEKSSSCCFSNVRTCNKSFPSIRACTVCYVEAVYPTEHALTHLMICRVAFSCENKISFSSFFTNKRIGTTRKSPQSAKSRVQRQLLSR